jgi:hypothetical protein
MKRPGSALGREARTKNLGEVKGVAGGSERMENIKEVKGKHSVKKNVMIGI